MFYLVVVLSFKLYVKREFFLDYYFESRDGCAIPRWELRRRRRVRQSLGRSGVVFLPGVRGLGLSAGGSHSLAGGSRRTFLLCLELGGGF